MGMESRQTPKHKTNVWANNMNVKCQSLTLVDEKQRMTKCGEIGWDHIGQ